MTAEILFKMYVHIIVHAYKYMCV